MNSTIKNQAGKISELFDSTSDVGIILGENQNLDTVAAALGLYLTLNSSGKSVQIVSKKVPEVAVSSLFGVDKIKQSFGGLAKMVTISIPYHEEIEKVSYNIEGDKLFVNLFAEEQGINLDESQIEYIKKGSNPGLIITIGVPDERELLSFVDPSTVRTLHIDTNSMNALLGDVSLVDPSFSSVSEIVAEVIRELALGIDQDGYQNLIEGINFATKGFTSPATSGFAFEAAGFLMQNGAKRPERKFDQSNFQEPRPKFQEPNRDQGQKRDDRNRDRNRDRQDRGPRRDLPAGRQGDRGNFPQDALLNQRPPRNPQGRNQDHRSQMSDQRFNNQGPTSNTQDPTSNNQPQPVANQVFNQPEPVAEPVFEDQSFVAPIQPQASVQDDFAHRSDAATAGITIQDPLNQAPQPYKAPRSNNQQPTSREAVDMDMPESFDSNTTEGAVPAQIPDDWFLPKVFKGSKKPNN